MSGHYHCASVATYAYDFMKTVTEITFSFKKKRQQGNCVTGPVDRYPLDTNLLLLNWGLFLTQCSCSFLPLNQRPPFSSWRCLFGFIASH